MAEALPVDVLLIEDEDDIRDGLVDLLESHGLRVVAVCDGRPALEYLSTSSAPRLILLDLMMPGMDGAVFRQKQLEKPAWAAIPVVVLSAAGETRAKALGVCAVVRKPIDVDVLLMVIRHYSSAA